MTIRLHYDSKNITLVAENPANKNLMHTLLTPYKLFWYSIPLILILAFVGRDYHTLDIQYHDSYYIFTVTQVGVAFSSLLFIHGILYYFLRHEKTNQMLVWAQVVMTISVCVLSMISGLFWKDWVATDIHRFRIAYQITQILTLLLFLSQVLWVPIAFGLVFGKIFRGK